MNRKYRFCNLLTGQDRVTMPKNIVNEARTEATVYVYDEISWWGVTAENFVSQLNDLMDVPTINVRVNSPGGDVFEAIAMQTAMAQHPANIIVHVDGIAASAASVFIRGANKRIISDGGFLMIHQAMSGVYGNAKELLSVGKALNKIDKSIINSYIKLTGVDRETVTEWVKAETWFSAEEAKEHGFVDEVFEAEPIKNVFDVGAVYQNTPKSLIENVVPDVEETEKPVSKYELVVSANARELELVELGA